MYVKEHESNQKIVIAICDEDLIGKTFSEGNKQIEIKKSFYKGEKITEKEVLGILKEADNLNLVGEKTIKIALKNKLIDKDSILKIKNIPHAQIITL